MVHAHGQRGESVLVLTKLPQFDKQLPLTPIRDFPIDYHA